MKDKKLHEKQEKYVYSIERLNGGALKRLSWQDLFNTIDELSNGVTSILQSLDEKACFGRGRKLDSSNKFDSIRKISYPPADQISHFGRCNRPNQAMYYAGIGKDLIASEIGATTGDIIGILHTVPIEKLMCLRIGALSLWRLTSGQCLMADDLKEQIKNIYDDPGNITTFLFDAFINDYFSRLADRHVYQLSSAYSHVMLGAREDIDGLIYDSVNHTAGSCIALRPECADLKLSPKAIEIVRVRSQLGYGIYDFEQLEFAESFDGEFIFWS